MANTLSLKVWQQSHCSIRDFSKRGKNDRKSFRDFNAFCSGFSFKTIFCCTGAKKNKSWSTYHNVINW